MTRQRTIAAVTSTRADYGLLRPVLRKLAADPAIRLYVVVTGAHLAPWLGQTETEIAEDADIAACIRERLPVFFPGSASPASAIARVIRSFDEFLARRRPDAVLLLGDRFEIFAAATAAAGRHVPIAHISGGDVTQGADDDFYRHCISQMASLHFPSNAGSAARLVRMGAAPDTVFNVGGLGDENLRTRTLLPLEELARGLGWPQLTQGPFGLVTLHPETASGAPDAAAQAAELTAALAQFPQVFWVCTGSNADSGGAACSIALQAFASARPAHAVFVPSLGSLRYLSALKYAAVVVGNSSSGVVETPTFGVPAVNIGARQQGRPICENVLCCPGAAEDIAAAIRQALTPDFVQKARTAVSPYNGGDTSGRIVEVLRSFDLSHPRRFFDPDTP